MSKLIIRFKWIFSSLDTEKVQQNCKIEKSEKRWTLWYLPNSRFHSFVYFFRFLEFVTWTSVERSRETSYRKRKDGNFVWLSLPGNWNKKSIEDSSQIFSLSFRVKTNHTQHLREEGTKKRDLELLHLPLSSSLPLYSTQKSNNVKSKSHHSRHTFSSRSCRIEGKKAGTRKWRESEETFWRGKKR